MPTDRKAARLRCRCFSNLLLGHHSNNADPVNSMPTHRRIIVTESDFALLRRLASHPPLAAELGDAAVVASRRVPPDVVTMNSRVLFEDESTGERREVTIVFPQLADSSKSISVLAPVGTALLGMAAGQSIVWPFPDGTKRSLRVLELIYQPEAHEALSRRAAEKRNSSREAG